MLTTTSIPRIKRAILAAMAVACGTVSSCGFGVQDLRHNVIAGSLSFVKSYTADFWGTVIPSWDEILNSAD
jgi:hypothetical protein